MIGDIRDLAIQGNNYINDKEVDKVILALSTIGLIATASTIYSLGATAPAKYAISVLNMQETQITDGLYRSRH